MKAILAFSSLTKWLLLDNKESVWIRLKVALHFQAFFFFFFLRVNSKITWFYCAWDKKHYLRTVQVLFMGPMILFTHLKIILLQCFQFLVFSFSNNKLNPNEPKVFSFLKLLLTRLDKPKSSIARLKLLRDGNYF